MFNYCYDSSRYSSCYRWTSCICRFDGTSYSKILIEPDYAKILPLTALLGGILVLVADVIARYLEKRLLAQSFHLSVFLTFYI